METKSDITASVKQLYDTYPFPPDPLLDEPPPGYNWRWSWPLAYSFCTGQKPPTFDIRILDAGCGTGSSTEYLVYLNPQASVTAIDLSPVALDIAKERCRRSLQSYNQSGNLPPLEMPNFQNMSLYDVGQLEGEFEFINSVGVLHHLADPVRGLQALATKLAPGGIIHIFVYAELGRWEISLMQEAIGLLQGDQRGDYQDGVAIGRKIFASLPEENRLVKYEKQRWAIENHRDECFADMYVHPHEIDYNVNTLFDLIDASGLVFLGFSNPEYWDLERLLGKETALMDKAQNLSDRDRYRLIEVLDPEISHYEFFLGRPPLPSHRWSNDGYLLGATPELSPCLHGWPSQTIFDANYKLVTLSINEFEFLQKVDGIKTVNEILAEVNLTLDDVRSIFGRQFILLIPPSEA